MHKSFQDDKSIIPVDSPKLNVKAPSSFLWGVATSSYQFEGGILNNDWNYFTTNESIKNRISMITKQNRFYKGISQVTLEPAGHAVRMWEPEFYLRDFDNASSLGLNAFRISIEWARIQPERNVWNEHVIDNYKKMIGSMREKKLTPIVTLNHLTLPLWISTPPTHFKGKKFQKLAPHPIRDLPLGDPEQSDPYWKAMGGWENTETVSMFAKFVERIVTELKDKVDYWVTINEPVATVIGGGYFAGIFPPGFFLDGKRASKVMHNLIEAHVKAYDVISSVDDIDADGDDIPKKVGFSHLMVAVKPVTRKTIMGLGIDNTEAAKRFSYFINDYFINAVTKGEEDINYLRTLEIHDKYSKDFLIHDQWKNKVDFIGLNYYRSAYVYHSMIVSISTASFIGGVPINDISNHNQPHGVLNDLGWEVYPEGLYDFIMDLHNKWQIPIFVTENGVADRDDKLRAKFIISHLRELKKGIADGAKVIGYLHWSLMDSYEWQEGYSSRSRFGLFSIDRQDKNYSRHVTNGAKALKRIIERSLQDNQVISESALQSAMSEFGQLPEGGL